MLKSLEIETEPVLLFERNFVKESDFAIDTRTNFGIYSKFISKFVSSNRSVISIIPFDNTCNFLINNFIGIELLTVESHERFGFTPSFNYK